MTPTPDGPPADEEEIRRAPRAWHPTDLDLYLQRELGAPAHRDGPPPAARTAPGNGRHVQLPAPAPLPATALGDILATRRSRRAYSPAPLPLTDLSTLLHHAARTTGTLHDATLGDHAFHPYPSAGARAELEVYVVAGRVTGVLPGAYHYDTVTHRLTEVAPSGPQQDELYAYVRRALDKAETSTPPAAILLVTAVLQRLTWKYGRLGLTLMYQNLGCLYQTLYLVATALGLAPCAVGVGRGRQNARWLDLDPYTEPEVGCFALGRPRR
ncbi:hypothetical protein SRB5_38360 [Streptomyces sp. RB5]|uniref:Nitroreductase domain-containing protein n=1 Tax=Streptomyces smaragdinus TaxID=2585196 RepID=A0A7K0CJR1_9ACTN|nr:SagB family peptide dehydrogenase [Streptomyces smaragdinus]MQY13686.1 hypothetical protein [Streptomyces smaragdinus]